MNIPFSPPDITDVEIEEVVAALKSGWITTGPKTKEFERQITECKNSLPERSNHRFGNDPESIGNRKRR